MTVSLAAHFLSYAMSQICYLHKSFHVDQEKESIVLTFTLNLQTPATEKPMMLVDVALNTSVSGATSQQKNIICIILICTSLI